MQSKKIKAIRHLSERHRQVTVEYLEDMLENFCNAELKKTQMVFRENITYMSNTLYYIKIKLYRGLPKWSSVKNLPNNAGNEV